MKLKLLRRVDFLAEIPMRCSDVHNSLCKTSVPYLMIAHIEWILWFC